MTTTTVRTVCCCGTEHTHQCPADWSQGTPAAPTLLRDALTRAEQAEATLTVAREIAGRLAAHAVGFQDVLDESDRDPWGKMIGADIAALGAALSDPQPAVPFACATPGGTCRRPADCAYGCRDAADDVTRLGQEMEAEQDGLYLRLCRILGLPADTTDDDLIEAVRGLLVREARVQQAEPLLRGTAPGVHVHVTPEDVRDAVRRIIREDRAQLRDLLR